VFFDAVVSGPKGVQLLVNGLPCFFQAAVVRASQEKPALVECPALSRSRPLLSLVLQDGQLQVLRNHSVIGVLKPGQGL
jgi:hypothetical protein